MYVLCKIILMSKKSLSAWLTSEAQFRVPDWGDKVDYGIGMSYRPVRLHWLAGWYDNHRLLTPSPLSAAKAGRNNLNE
jgi:hypothetical protein